MIASEPEDTAEINRQVDHLEKLFERFEEAEQKFWEALRNQQPPGS